ncbi:MAG TPA: molybdate ABC transporter substrate-binding protein [Intrasporangium sp.]|uniref:molybdate ABC transporter substrate-binding protein n=1 Tax=Intrasporangium sp. TaxID=1925024 RepID=UPI002D76B755|nr:molybdate ABC transporter substrate-binding protein [Intrasporangium sp.]HET7397029.1 molybdate ABC transporter substrate-binding protein [Intrasporangium sp.]
MTARTAARRACAGAALMLALVVSACGRAGLDSDAAGGDTATAASASSARGTVVVLAAASLTDAFDRITADFEAAHPGVDVSVSYGSSSTLVQQANHGAPADVLALAGEAAAGPLDPSLVRERAVFATNVLEIAVPPGNPAHVGSLRDLGRPGLALVLCASRAPCGAASDAILAKAGVAPSVVSREVDVKATLAKVRLGEADAAVVYASDVAAAKGAVTGIRIPPEANTTLRYPVLRLDDDAATRAYVDFVRSDAARSTLESVGFGAP